MPQVVKGNNSQGESQQMLMPVMLQRLSLSVGNVQYKPLVSKRLPERETSSMSMRLLQDDGNDEPEKRLSRMSRLMRSLEKEGRSPVSLLPCRSMYLRRVESGGIVPVSPNEGMVKTER